MPCRRRFDSERSESCQSEQLLQTPCSTHGPSIRNRRCLAEVDGILRGGHMVGGSSVTDNDSNADNRLQPINAEPAIVQSSPLNAAKGKAVSTDDVIAIQGGNMTRRNDDRPQQQKQMKGRDLQKDTHEKRNALKKNASDNRYGSQTTTSSQRTKIRNGVKSNSNEGASHDKRTTRNGNSDKNYDITISVPKRSRHRSNDLSVTFNASFSVELGLGSQSDESDDDDDDLDDEDHSEGGDSNEGSGDQGGDPDEVKHDPHNEATMQTTVNTSGSGSQALPECKGDATNECERQPLMSTMTEITEQANMTI